MTEFQSTVNGNLSTALYYIRVDRSSTESLKESVERALRELNAVEADTVLLYTNKSYWPFLLNKVKGFYFLVSSTGLKMR